MIIDEARFLVEKIQACATCMFRVRAIAAPVAAGTILDIKERLAAGEYCANPMHYVRRSPSPTDPPEKVFKKLAAEDLEMPFPAWCQLPRLLPSVRSMLCVQDDSTMLIRLSEAVAAGRCKETPVVPVASNVVAFPLRAARVYAQEDVDKRGGVE